MNVMHTVYDRSGGRFDFCEDDETQYDLEYDRELDTLSVRQWTPHCKGGPWPVCAVFYQPRRYVKDATL